MSDARDHIRRLVLSYEELEQEERAEADAILAASPAYRQLLDRLRAVERSAGPTGELPSLESLVAAMDAGERAAADRSLEALRDRLDARVGGRPAEGAPARERAWTRLVRRLTPRRPFGPIALAVATCAVAALLIRGGRDESEPLVLALDLRTPAGARGSAAAPHDAGAPWRTGEAFAIGLELRAPAYVVVVNADPSGELAILHPARGPIPRVPAGRPLEIPSPASGETWRLEGAPGQETFFVVASERSDVDLDALADALGEVAASPTSRTERLRRAEKLLETRLGPTRRVDVRHEP